MTGELKLRIKLECRLNVGARASKIYSFGSSPLATRLSTILQDYSPPMENHFVACLPKGSPLFANICILNNRSDTNPVYAYICVHIYIYYVQSILESYNGRTTLLRVMRMPVLMRRVRRIVVGENSFRSLLSDYRDSEYNSRCIRSTLPI